MPLKLGINGFGRIGRLALRVLQSWDDIEVIRINDPAGDATTLAGMTSRSFALMTQPGTLRPWLG